MLVLVANEFTHMTERRELGSGVFAVWDDHGIEEDRREDLERPVRSEGVRTRRHVAQPGCEQTNHGTCPGERGLSSTGRGFFKVGGDESAIFHPSNAPVARPGRERQGG